MDIGNGIAIAGVWIMVGMLGMAPSITSYGWFIGLGVAIAATIYLK